MRQISGFNSLLYYILLKHINASFLALDDDLEELISNEVINISDLETLLNNIVIKSPGQTLFLLYFFLRVGSFSNSV